MRTVAVSTIGLEAADPSDFEQRTGETFGFRIPPREGESEQRAELELVRVTRHRERPEGLTLRGVRIRSKPFSLLFRTATDYSRLRYTTAAIDHRAFAPALLLLAPVAAGPDDPSFLYYEVIFN